MAGGRNNATVRQQPIDIGRRSVSARICKNPGGAGLLIWVQSDRLARFRAAESLRGYAAPRVSTRSAPTGVAWIMDGSRPLR
jgi:hypothetical protein